MKDKEKQIEEMAIIISGSTEIETIEYYNAFIKAKQIYEIIFPKDSVVLSREEYEKLRSLYDCEQGSYMTSSIGDLPLTVEGLRKAVDEITRLNRVEAELQELNIKYYNEAKDLRRELKQARKETAEKILKKGEEFYKMTYHKSNAIHRLAEWIKDTFGIEIKE